jgi:SAM-dependent methyltransferase
MSELRNSNPNVRLADVQALYDGAPARLYELFMGRQIHVGGLRSSLELAELAGISAGLRGVELCCGSGATMRALVRLLDVASMIGVEAATAPVERGRQACYEQGLDDRIQFVIGDASDTRLPDAEADFVWSEDSWCYVVDKPKLIAEAIRLTCAGGVIVFTDWVEGPAELSDEEAQHVMQLMTFPSLFSIDAYRELFEREGCHVVVAEDTGLFARAFGLYADVVEKQLAFDAFEILGFSRELVDVVVEQLRGFARLGYEAKLGQVRFVARLSS